MGSPKGVMPEGELNFLDYFDNRGCSSEPDVVKYNKTLIVKGSSQLDAVKYDKDSKPLHDLVLGTKP
jgi:hypothetical protein